MRRVLGATYLEASDSVSLALSGIYGQPVTRSLIGPELLCHWIMRSLAGMSRRINNSRSKSAVERLGYGQFTGTGNVGGAPDATKPGAGYSLKIASFVQASTACQRLRHR